MGKIIYIAGRHQHATLLLVERNAVVRTEIAAHLRQAGLEVVEAGNTAEMFKLLRAGRPVSAILGALKPHVVGELRREFPQVKLLLGQDDLAPVSLHGLPTVRRPYDLREVETAAKSLMRARKISR
jgi:DNA-binding response OmpR family regulator